MNPLPIWLLYMQAFALIAIPAVGAWLAWQQVRIARAKLRHDLYDRRFKVYDAALQLFAQALRDGTPSEEAMRDYRFGTADAVFLLDDAMVQYLQEVHTRFSAIRARRLTLDAARDQDERVRLAASIEQDGEWLRNEIVVMRDKFKPFLVLPQVKPCPC